MLTKLLRENADLEAELASLVPKEEIGTSYDAPPLLAFPRTTNYALVGTAFDYLMRWEIRRRNPKAIVRPWVATLCVEKILPAMREDHFHSDPILAVSPFEPVSMKLAKLYVAVEAEARRVYTAYIQKPKLAQADLRRACQMVLCLSKIDGLYRSGTQSPDVNRFAPLDVADLETVFESAPWEDLAGDETTIPWLNPEFGRYTKILRGSDADLVIGDTLLDLKTSKYADIEKHLAQLVGYGILGDRYRTDENPSYPNIQKVGIYFSRHGWIRTLDYRPIRSNRKYRAAGDHLIETAKAASASFTADVADKVVHALRERAEMQNLAELSLLQGDRAEELGYDPFDHDTGPV